MGPLKLGMTGIDDSLLPRKFVCTAIEQVSNRHLEEFDPLNFCLPVGPAIVGHAHKNPL